MDNLVLNLTEVSYYYPGVQKPALEKINLQIQAGEFVGIVGSNGAGRSTLCYTMNGLIPQAIGGKLEGEVIVHGINTQKSTTAEIAQSVGLVFSDPEAQLTQLTVYDEVAFGPCNLGLPVDEINRRIKESLKLVQLEGFEDRNTHSLSGGQQQRLAIASVLAMKPDILILDEATSNLDPLGTYEVFSIARRLNQENKTTVIMVDHQVDLLAGFASRILIIDQGQIISDGPPQEAFSQVELMAAKNIQIPQVTDLFSRLEKADIFHPDRLPVNVERGSEILAALFREKSAG